MNKLNHQPVSWVETGKFLGIGVAVDVQLAHLFRRGQYTLQFAEEELSTDISVEILDPIGDVFW